jgi:hypothetical protein
LGKEERDLDAGLQDCLIGYARGRVLGPDYTLEFGKWNPRALEKTEAKKLADNMRTNEVRGFRPAAVIPIVVRRADLIGKLATMEAALNDAGQLPELRFVEGRGGKILAAGGRHRQAALKILAKELDDEIKKHSEKLKSLKDRKTTAPEQVEEFKTLGRKVASLTQKRSVLDQWGFAVYDLGESHTTVWSADDYIGVR